MNLFLNGALSIFIILSFAYLIAGNIIRFIQWFMHRKIRKEIGIQCIYLNFWGKRTDDYTKEELEKLHQLIEQYEKKVQK